MTSAAMVVWLMRVAMMCLASTGRCLSGTVGKVAWRTEGVGSLHANHYGNFCDRHRPELAHGVQFFRCCPTRWWWIFRRRRRAFDRTFGTSYVPSRAVGTSVACAFFAAGTQCLEFQQGPPSGPA